MLACSIAVLMLQGPAGQSAYRTIEPRDVRVTSLSPTGWELSAPALSATPLTARSFAADRMRAFSTFYVRNQRLIGLGKASAGEGALVWDPVQISVTREGPRRRGSL